MLVTTTVRFKINVPDYQIQEILDEEDSNYTVEKLICETIGYLLSIDDEDEEVTFISVVDIESVNNTDIILQER